MASVHYKVKDLVHNLSIPWPLFCICTLYVAIPYTIVLKHTI